MKTITKKILHYFLLAATLVGIPLVCCILGGKDDTLALVRDIAPVTEDWGSRPGRLWNCKCPFSWWAFLGLIVFVIVCLRPFVSRVVRNVRKGGLVPAASTGRFPVWGWIGLFVMSVGWILSWTRFAWFAPCQRYPFFPLWIGFIVVVNALCMKRSGHSLLTDHPRLYLLSFPASSAFWWFFEYLNRYVWNWYYVGVPGISATEYVIFATLCFSTVLPAVTVIAAWLGTFPLFSDEAFAAMMRVNLRSPGAVTVMAVLSLVGLVGIVFIPQFAYPLLWISPLMVFVLLQLLLGEPCSLDGLATGNWSLVLRFAVASLICGLAWETWNFYSLAKWIYAVPYVHRFQVWEMPILGFAGYLPFGMECAAVAGWISAKLIGSNTH